ncbi:YbaB/EbfC family nucleoid-associated protein [Actinoplanes sp. NPDC051851]|uniref:YbaB/EbfC family nucleoid-associated protein n=1 Tax=Actinoplanes sp. NPDC051851 TaxID=3154753 RepID=UPI003421AA42
MDSIDVDRLRSGLDTLLQQVHTDTTRIVALQEDLWRREITGYAADGAVTVRLSGTGTFLDVTIDPDTLRRYDAFTVGQLVLTAINDALTRLQSATQSVFTPPPAPPTPSTTPAYPPTSYPPTSYPPGSASAASCPPGPAYPAVSHPAGPVYPAASYPACPPVSYPAA